jgi:hypothetical protein
MSMIRPRSGERGSALMMALITTIIMIGISGTYLGLTMWSKTETVRTRDAAQAAFIAEAAAGNYINSLNLDAVPSILPVAPNPKVGLDKIRTDKTTKWLGGWFLIEERKSGSYSNDDYREFMVTAEYGGAQRRLQVVISRKAGGVFWNAIYAQNSSGSDNYTLAFAGTGSKKDVVKGDIYSGGKLSHTGQAQLLNESGQGGSNQVMYASDATDALVTGVAQTPAPNYVNGAQPSLDIAGMNYAGKAAAVNSPTDPAFDPKVVNVADRFAKYAADGYVAGETGPNQGCGVAKQINQKDDPAHIFRLNPKDNGNTERVQSYSGLNTDHPNDFFLEDPTRKAGAGSAGGDWLGSDGGQRINIQPSGNDKVYYIDGNLWVSNSPAYSFQFENNTGADMKITLIVKGNVYLTDNLLYDRSKSNDALAIIAIKDEEKYPNRTPEGYLDPSSPYYNPSLNYAGAEDAARDYNKKSGSGNIFFGDPGGGTTERFESFMFAENNFYDHNLGDKGTNLTNIYGNMTAGNHVQVKRQASAYKPMQVTFDERLRTGATSLPGLPGNLVDAGEKWRVVGWNTNPQKWTGGTVSTSP